jgi:2-polyprenyl-3-methyl-5-hydroxy-6-metoxy-1,4-benzoquinol methylase
MIFAKDKEMAALGIIHYNAKFQNNISFRIVKNKSNWKLLICTFNSQLGWDGSKFVEYGECKTLAEAKEWSEELVEKFAKDAGIDKKTIDVYNDEAEKIAKLHASLTPHRIYELINQYFIKGKSTVDIGCGIGRDTNFLNSQGFSVVGVDASQGMLKQAKKLYSDLDFQLDYLPTLASFENSTFQNILCSAVLMHLEEIAIEAACLRLVELLKKDGRLIISIRGTNEKDKRENGKLYEAINVESFKELFEKNGCEILLYEKEIEQKRGLTWHNFVIKK